MSKNLVHLNTNPCKMCMPMGSVSAFCGIRGCMNILHGSQGCATYIRRHMATHYNEPVDIASSSLTEEGTVFGGEKNLVKGLDNLIKLYNPQVIGLSTTCLAETIGEDVDRMVADFLKARPNVRTRIITVPTPGYGGAQYEGFFRALRALVEQIEMDARPNGRVNIITGMMSPADTRFLKGLFKEMGVDAALLPDLSENLDGPHEEVYRRLSYEGTSLEDISAMAGARCTIELSSFIEEEFSPGRYLEAAYGVPLLRSPLPLGLRDTDAFIRLLEEAGGRLTDELKKERGRYLDAMVDSHKYNARLRAAVFGEPDFVYSLCRLLAENGALPVIAAAGSKCAALEALLEEELAPVREFHLDQKNVILDDCDFDTIEELSREYGVNILIGSSDGRRVEEHLGIPLVRCAFPVHDHVGGQRIRTLGYRGSLTLLDRITNTILGETERRFRRDLYRKYYRGVGAPLTGKTGGAMTETNIPIQETARAVNLRKNTVHPCFSGRGGKRGRIHLPVAALCNIQCNYCVRKYSCAHESRPGVTAAVVSPAQALERYLKAKELMPEITVAGIAGPGDSLADFEKTRETLTLIRRSDPGAIFCLSTNGLMLPFYAGELAALGVSHVTVTVNAVHPRVGAEIYRHVDYQGERYAGETAAALLMANQLAGIRQLRDLGMICKVNTVVLKGINDDHIPAIAEKVRELGADLANIMQLIPVEGSAFEKAPMISNREIMETRKSCAPLIPQMYHCRQCRADAAGTLDCDRSRELWETAELTAAAVETAGTANGLAEGTAPAGDFSAAGTEGMRFAVSSRGGVLVDQHFGHAEEFYIYEWREGAPRFKERRSAGKYCTGECGEKESRMDAVIKTIGDCNCIIALRIGEAPRLRLRTMGIKTFMTYSRIEDAVKEAAEEIIGEGTLS
ncbi:MAG: nitrogenase cofactor biosynthesis protein NifB [Treponema sp.]|nr:nitrogenase cofactor biosynthesis protein NifB [Treponema sp.]